MKKVGVWLSQSRIETYPITILFAVLDVSHSDTSVHLIQ